MFGVHDLHGDEQFVEIEEPVVNAATTTTTTATTTATTTVADEVEITLVKGLGSKDKGKENMIEPKKPLKKKDQVLFDEQEAIRIQAQFDEEARVAREKEEANDELFDKAMKRVNTFVDFITELVKGTEREESSKRDETIGQESSSKRAGGELEQEKVKKQKIDDDQEEAKMKELMEVVSNEEGIAINAI
ncbi:hypothetical protein Tco_0056977, partial [Tanacetum coccineum]